MSKLSAKRQEDIANQGCIPLLLYLTKNYPKKIKKVSIAMICQLVQTSDKTRKKLWEYGGPKIIVQNIKHQIYKPMLLNALLHWVKADPTKVEPIFLDFKIVDQLCDSVFVKDVQGFGYILPIFANLVQYSGKLAVRLSKSSKFIKRLVERLTQSYQPEDLDNNEEEQDSSRKNKDTAIQVKAILDIILNISIKTSDPKSLLDKHNLYPILLDILQKA